MRNKKLAALFRDRPCIACFKQPSDCDHVFNFAGDSDKDIEENCWALCRPCHILKGQIGLTEFVKRFNLEDEMLSRSSWFDGRRWRKHFTEIK